MRLRQLARKLGVHPEKILTVLADSGHELENEANSKLTEEQVNIAQEHFPPPVQEVEQPEEVEQPKETVQVPETVAEVIAPSAEEVITVRENVVAQEPANEVTIEEAAVDPDLAHLEVPFGPPSHATSQVSDLAESVAVTPATEEPKKIVIQLEEPKPEVKVYNAIEEDEEFINAELIKTEKPVLEGLKVVGKIELPEPKKPAEKIDEADDTEAAATPEGKDNKRRNGRNDRGRSKNGRSQRERLSPLEYERQKAERIAKRKKLEAEKKLKEKKEQHYKATLEAKARAKKKSQLPKPKPKKVVKQVEETIAPLPINGMSRPKPEVKKVKRVKKQKGPLKRLWGWLNGESDQF